MTYSFLRRVSFFFYSEVKAITRFVSYTLDKLSLCVLGAQLLLVVMIPQCEVRIWPRDFAGKAVINELVWAI